MKNMIVTVRTLIMGISGFLLLAGACIPYLAQDRGVLIVFFILITSAAAAILQSDRELAKIDAELCRRQTEINGLEFAMRAMEDTHE